MLCLDVVDQFDVFQVLDFCIRPPAPTSDLAHSSLRPWIVPGIFFVLLIDHWSDTYVLYLSHSNFLTLVSTPPRTCFETFLKLGRELFPLLLLSSPILQGRYLFARKDLDNEAGTNGLSNMYAFFGQLDSYTWYGTAV